MNLNEMQNEVYLSLGSNIGDRMKNLEKAIDEISLNNKIINRSKIYETEPWGDITKTQSGGFFLNMVLHIKTELSPEALLVFLKSVEKKLGRVKTEKSLPRTIDIDILFFENRIIKKNELTIPHPEIQNRKFVLVPFCDISESFIHPVSGQTVCDLLKTTKDKCFVRLYN